MKDLFKRVALLLKSSLIPLTFSILGFSAHADNYYVSVNGNDVNYPAPRVQGVCRKAKLFLLRSLRSHSILLSIHPCGKTSWSSG
jgi:hypothetical protein